MNRARILVIDDDPLFRSLLTALLPAEFQVTVASDGAEGYYKALELPPHLAIVDVKMPGWDGLRTLKAFRSHHLLARVPIMMLTSDASRTTVMSALEAGASDYVVKTTLSREEFIRKVVRLANPESGCRSGAEVAEENNGGEFGRETHLGGDSPKHLAAACPAGDRSNASLDNGPLKCLIVDWE
jgi:DNA-binding response OmpR family regulator